MQHPHHTKQRGPFLFLLTLLILSTCLSSTPKTGDKIDKLPFRYKNLDHWDDDTICAYLHLNQSTLQPQTPTAASKSFPDAVIMFYAQWCPNCHSLAPLYDNIATLLNAGFADSNKVMALYDCERNAEATKICAAVGISVYPTLMYVSPHTPYHDSDFLTKRIFGVKRACGRMGCTQQANTVKFQGDWRYGEQIYDWIVMMGGLSQWRKWWNGVKKSSWGKGGAKKGKEALPVGIPQSTAGAASNANVTALTKLVAELESKKGQYEDAAKHSGMLIDFIMFADASSTEDAFHTVTSLSLWGKDEELETSDSILLSCVMDLAIDYCTRKYLHEAYILIGELEHNTGRSDANTTEQHKEPYCEIIEDCFMKNFKSKECRPDSCPFRNAVGCTYVNSCTDTRIQKEYAKVLGLEEQKKAKV